MRKRVVPSLAAWLSCCGSAAYGAASTDTVASAAGEQIKIGNVDLAIILIYLVGIVALGCWAGLRKKRQARGSDYFLAGKSLRWPMIGLALFATNISTIHLVSFAQNGYTSGLVYGNFEWMAAFTLVILAWFFAPFYIRSGVATLPDFLERRYSRGSRDYLAVLSIFSAITVHIGFSLHTGAIVIEGILLRPYVDHPEQYHFWTILAICGATAIYTIVGGLLAVVVTESIQTVVLLFGSICITVLGLYMLGGWDGSWPGLLGVGQAFEGWARMKQNVHPANLSMIRPDTDPTGVSWYAVMFGYPVLGIWYWCTDQTIVQRVLGAKDENHARIGPLFAGFIKILPVLIFVIPGIICLGLVNGRVIPPLPTNPDGSPATQETYAHLVDKVLPLGMRGVVVAALLAALMSTVSGALNSIATLFSYDIYKRFKPQADDRHLVRVGRMATFVAVCVAIAWTMGIGGQESIFQMMVNVFPVVAPPTAVVFMWGVFWRRASARASLITLVAGSLVGLVLFLLNTKGMNRFGDYEVNALLQAFILFVLESIVLVVLSYVFPHKHTAESEALVWKSPLEALRSQNAWRGLGDFRVVSVLLIVVMVGFYVWFAGEDTYYSVDGQVTLADGTPVSGAEISFACDDPRFNFSRITDPQGNYHCATKEQAGGAPAGTRYKVQIVPQPDLTRRVQEVARDENGRILPAAKQPSNNNFVFSPTRPSPPAPLPHAGEGSKHWMATKVPPKYHSFDTSGLSCTVEAEPMLTTQRKRYDFRLLSP